MEGNGSGRRGGIVEKKGIFNLTAKELEDYFKKRTKEKKNGQQQGAK